MSGHLPDGCTQRECDEACPGYWDDDEIDEAPELYECDCCGKMVEPDSISRCWPFGIETYACEKCRGVEP